MNEEKPTIFTLEKGWHREGDLPFNELVIDCTRLYNRGITFWVKFTCQNCHARQTSATKNIINKGGYTCEECGALTHPKAYGYMLLMTSRTR
jgi:uncharacterized protein YlaI